MAPGTERVRGAYRVVKTLYWTYSVTSVNTEANVLGADWLMSGFVNELAPPHMRSQQGQCVQQCRRIMKDTLAKFRRIILQH